MSNKQVAACDLQELLTEVKMPVVIPHTYRVATLNITFFFFFFPDMGDMAKENSIVKQKYWHGLLKKKKKRRIIASNRAEPSFKSEISAFVCPCLSFQDREATLGAGWSIRQVSVVSDRAMCNMGHSYQGPVGSTPMPLRSRISFPSATHTIEICRI